MVAYEEIMMVAVSYIEIHIILLIIKINSRVDIITLATQKVYEPIC